MAQKIMSRLCRKNIYESFIYIAILTFIGGFMNAYTYTLHDGYLATMNTGNMARIGLAISAHNMAGTAPYFMSIAANALGAMTTFICRTIITSNTEIKWQKVCLMAELVIFFCVGLLPASVPHAFVNFTISFIAGFQLASFTLWNDNAVATTLGSGNVRFIGEHMGNALLNPSWKNFLKFMMFFCITSSFVFGVVIGSNLSNGWGRYSIYFVCFLLLFLLVLEADLSYYIQKQEAAKANKKARLA